MGRVLLLPSCAFVLWYGCVAKYGWGSARRSAWPSTIFARASPFGTEDPGYVSKLESVRVVTIIGDVKEVHEVFQLIEKDGPALGLHLNVKKNEIWWPCRALGDPFPADVDRVENAGVKLLGAPIGSREFTTEFVKKKLKALDDVGKTREVDNAQVEFGLFRGCLSYNKINHLL